MGRRTRRVFDAQFKAEAVRLCQLGNRSIAQVASDLDLTETALRQWVKRAQIDAGAGPADALTTAERQELAQLRRDNKRLLLEREILKNPPGGALRPVEPETPDVLSPLLPGWSDRLLFGDARAR